MQFTTRIWTVERKRKRERGERENGLKFYIIWHKELYRIQGFVSTMISSPLLSQSNNELVHCLWKYHEFQLRHVRKRAQHNHSLSVKNTHEMKKSETKTETDTHTKNREKGWNALHWHWHCTYATSSHVLNFHFHTMSNN